jgi:hypothetical protein
VPTITSLQDPNPQKSRSRQHQQQQQQQQLTDFSEQQKQKSRQYQHLLPDNNKDSNKTSIMHHIKRSPILKLVAAVAVNVGFILICQQHWRATGDNNNVNAAGSKDAGSGSMPEQILVQQQIHQQQNPLNQQYAIVDETPLRTFEVWYFYLWASMMHETY